jgi:hypothetical protein
VATESTGAGAGTGTAAGTAASTAVGTGATGATSGATERERLEATLGALGNEFEENHKIIAGSYPTLFPLGLTPVQFRGVGTPNSTVVKLLLHWHDARFARCESLLFLFFNQMMRHKVSANVSAHLNGTNENIDNLIAMIDDPTFERKIAKELRLLAAGEKVSKEGQRILQKMERACKMSSQRINWTQRKRTGITSLIIALSQRFGNASMFVTVSPPQFNSPLALRLSLDVGKRLDDLDEIERTTAQKEGTPDTDWTLEFPELSEQARATLLAKNPVSDAKLYEKIINAFFSALVQCDPVGVAQSTAHKLKHRIRGVFGHVKAFCNITETRKCGAVVAVFVVVGCC